MKSALKTPTGNMPSCRTKIVIWFGALMLSVGLGKLSAQTFSTAFGPYRGIPVGARGECVAIGDLNGDGRADVVLGTERFWGGTNKESILIFFQEADGGLTEPVRYSVGDTVSSMAIEDFTGDGKNDIAVAMDRSGIRVFVQGTNADFSSFTDYTSGNSFRLCAGDFNNDGRSDLAGVGYEFGSVELFLQIGGVLSSVGLLPPNFGGWNEIEASDVNNDGLTDIVGISDTGYPRIYLQTPTGFAPAVTYVLDGKALGVGDLSGDGRPDIAMAVFGNRPNSKLSVLIQQTNGTMTPGPLLNSYDLPGAVVVTDVNLDGKADVLVLHQSWSRLGVYFQTNSGSLDSELLFEISEVSNRNPHGLAVGDITGDGMPDVVIADLEGLLVLTNRLPRPIPHLMDMRVESGNPRFRLNGTAGNRYLIETSSNLVTWVPWATNTIPAGGSIWLDDSTVPQPTRRFYRAMAHPGGATFNDMFADRISIASAGGTVTGSNAGATKESGERNHGGVPGGTSVWWTWTATSSGPAAIFTDGSNFDTTLAVYTGTALASLAVFAEDDDSGEGSRSRVVFNAVAGVSYHIAVDGFAGASGNIQLTVRRGVGNDSFANRWSMTGLSDLVLGYNVGASRETGEPYHWQATGGASVWWSWQAPKSGTVTFTTSGSSFDTVLAAYTGSTVSSLLLMANNDDNGALATSQITFNATAGTTYHIAVDGYGGLTGVIWLELFQP